MINFKMQLSLVFVLCLSLSACSSGKRIIVESDPPNAFVYLKGDPRDKLPNQKTVIGKTPLIMNELKYKTYSGDQVSMDLSDLVEKQVDFFLILEKDCYEPQSIRVPPFPDRPVRLGRIPNCQSATNAE